jgi:hypothetical protein
MDAVDHRLVEALCGLAAFAIGLGLLGRYSNQGGDRDWTFAIGLSFLTVGVTDFVHGAASGVVSPWTWAIGRTWMVAGFARSFLALHGYRYRVGEKISASAEIMLASLVMALALTLPLPEAYASAWPHRPYDLALALAFAGLAYCYRRSAALFVSLAMEGAACFLLCYSTAPLDTPDAIAHWVKLAAYLGMLIWVQGGYPIRVRP